MAGIEPAISFACGACSGGRRFERFVRCPSEKTVSILSIVWITIALTTGRQRQRSAANRGAAGRIRTGVFLNACRVSSGGQRTSGSDARCASRKSSAWSTAGRQAGSASVRSARPPHWAAARSCLSGARDRDRTGTFPLTRRVLVRSSYAGLAATTSSSLRRFARAVFVFLRAAFPSSAFAFAVGAATTCVVLFLLQGRFVILF